MKRQLAPLLAVVGLVLIVVLTLAWRVGTSLDFGEDPPPGDQPFAQTPWLGVRASHDGTRMAMRESAANAAKGLDESAVRELLGEPDRVESDPNRWWYLLGPEPGPFGIDSLWLVLDFSIDGLAQPIELTD